MEGQIIVANQSTGNDFEKLKMMCPTHSNGTLKRFLRAFLTAEKAYEMIVKNDKWRIDFNVDNLNEEDEDIRNEIATRKATLLDYRDLKGRPILFVRVKNHIAYERDLNKLTKFIVFMLERACEKCDEDIIDSLCIVFDLQDFGMTNMDYQFVQQLIWLLSRRYPERLGVCLIINYSWFFSSCWTVIRPWLSTNTTEKIVFVDRKTIGQYIHIDMLPKDCNLA